MIETLVVKLSRQELYDKIWEISVAGVSKEYGIPYSQLLKQVKAADIPVPPSGYWTKLSFGKPVEKTLLNGSGDTVVSLTKSVNAIIPHEIISVSAVKDTSETPPPPEDLSTEPVHPATEDGIAKIMSMPEDSEAVETLEQYGKTYNIYDREKLYQEVWAKPVTEVAKLYKVSDVAIHKVCRSLDIPTPGFGYWA